VQEVAATPEPIKEVFATPAPVDVVEVIKEEAPKPPRKKIERKVFVDATPEPVKEPAKEPAKEEAKEEAKATEPVKAVNPNVTRTREALKADGFTEDQLVALLIANQWGDYRNYSVGKTKIEDLDSEMLESFWEDDSWEIVKEDLTNAGKKGK
jgi:hypothetical protein